MCNYWFLSCSLIFPAADRQRHTHGTFSSRADVSYSLGRTTILRDRFEGFGGSSAFPPAQRRSEVRVNHRTASQTSSGQTGVKSGMLLVCPGPARRAPDFLLSKGNLCHYDTYCTSTQLLRKSCNFSFALCSTYLTETLVSCTNSWRRSV